MTDIINIHYKFVKERLSQRENAIDFLKICSIIFSFFLIYIVVTPELTSKNKISKEINDLKSFFS